MVEVDPLLIGVFLRVAISKTNDKDLQDLLRYELELFPLALYDERDMRKTKKSSLSNNFQVHQATSDLKLYSNVIDGGFVLHCGRCRMIILQAVGWSTSSTFLAVTKQYVTDIKKIYSECCTVVFYGYSDNTISIKRSDQHPRNTTKTESVDFNFTEKWQQQFNKKNLKVIYLILFVYR